MTAFILCKVVSPVGLKCCGSKVLGTYYVLGTGLGVSVSTQSRGEESAVKAAQRREPFTDHTQAGGVLEVSVAKAAWSLSCSGV